MNFINFCQSFLNYFYYKIKIYDSLNCRWHFRIQKKKKEKRRKKERKERKEKTIAIFNFNFVNSFCKIINKIWKWTCHKFCTINKFYFVRYCYIIFIDIFINFLNFFSIGIEKSFPLFSIFSKTVKLFIKFFC